MSHILPFLDFNSAGPVLSGRADGVSKETVTGIIEGKKGSIMPWVVDVRDIGRAHVLGIEVCPVHGQHNTAEARGGVVAQNPKSV